VDCTRGLGGGQKYVQNLVGKTSWKRDAWLTKESGYLAWEVLLIQWSF